jgi:hypothetical protein
LTEESRASKSLDPLDELLWVVDSGATRYMIYYRDAFTEFSALQQPVVIETASGAELQAVDQGTVVLKVSRDGTIYAIALTEVLYTLGLSGSLISVSQLQNKNITVRITGGKSLKRLLFERQSRILGEAKRLEKAYTLRGVNTGPERALAVVADSEARLVHRRLGHLSSGSL